MLADRYREGVSAGVAGYQHARADEDTVTGALGQALLGRGAFALSDGRVATWSTQYTRFGSAGKSGPAETRYGADGIFEIELTDDEGITTIRNLRHVEPDLNAEDSEEFDLRFHASGGAINPLPPFRHSFPSSIDPVESPIGICGSRASRVRRRRSALSRKGKEAAQLVRGLLGPLFRKEVPTVDAAAAYVVRPLPP